MSLIIDTLPTCFASDVPAVSGTSDVAQVFLTVTLSIGSQTTTIFSGRLSLPRNDSGKFDIRWPFLRDLIRRAVMSEALRRWSAVRATAHVTVSDGFGSSVTQSFDVVSSRSWAWDSERMPVSPDSCRFRVLWEHDVLTVPLDTSLEVQFPIFIAKGVRHTFEAMVSVSFLNDSGDRFKKAFAVADQAIFSLGSIPFSPADSAAQDAAIPYPVTMNLASVFAGAPVAVRQAVEILDFDVIVTHTAVYSGDVAETFTQQLVVRGRPMYNPACFSYRNPWGQQADIWLSVAANRESQLETSTAVVAGTLVAYDARRKSTLAVSSLVPPSMEARITAMQDSLCSFNGMPCVAEDPKITHSDEGLRFTANLRRADGAPWL